MICHCGILFINAKATMNTRKLTYNCCWNFCHLHKELPFVRYFERHRCFPILIKFLNSSYFNNISCIIASGFGCRCECENMWAWWNMIERLRFAAIRWYQLSECWHELTRMSHFVPFVNFVTFSSVLLFFCSDKKKTSELRFEICQ